MRSLHRTDANHSEVIKAFEALHCSVLDLSSIARKNKRNKGAQDLLIGVCRTNELVEVKTEDGEESESQIEFSKNWRGAPRHLVRNVDDVINLVQKIRMSIKNGITRNVSNVE